MAKASLSAPTPQMPDSYSAMMTNKLSPESLSSPIDFADHTLTPPQQFQISITTRRNMKMPSETTLAPAVDVKEEPEPNLTVPSGKQVS
jgi:hypothetical protein